MNAETTSLLIPVRRRSLRHFLCHALLSRARNAFSLVELAVVMVIIGLVAFAALRLAPGITQTANRTEFTSEVINDLNAVRGLFKGAYPAGPLNSYIITSNVIPLVNGALANTYGGTITITGAGATFTIQFAGIPPTACTDATTQGWDGATQYGATNISINGTAETLPISLPTAQSACNVNGQGGSSGNTINYTAS